MTVERRFLTGAREADTDEAGLVIEDDGKVWKVAPGGARVEVGVSSGGSIGSGFLSCYSVLSSNNAPNGSLIECEFEVAQIVGSDLSLDPDGKTIRVATTGWYQAAIQVYFGGPMDNFLFGTDTFGDDLPELKTYLPALALGYGFDLMFNDAGREDHGRVRLHIPPLRRPASGDRYLQLHREDSRPSPRSSRTIRRPDGLNADLDSVPPPISRPTPRVASPEWRSAAPTSTAP